MPADCEAQVLLLITLQYVFVLVLDWQCLDVRGWMESLGAPLDRYAALFEAQVSV